MLGEFSKVRNWIPMVVISVGALFYFFFDPMTTFFMPRCVFHEITGLQCMGCGAQRMIHALLHGDVGGAFRANAFLVLALPFLAFLAWLELNRKSHPRLYARIFTTKLIWATGGALALWLVLRNVLTI